MIVVVITQSHLMEGGELERIDKYEYYDDAANDYGGDGNGE